MKKPPNLGRASARDVVILVFCFSLLSLVYISVGVGIYMVKTRAYASKA